jgi:hypothetical protein
MLSDCYESRNHEKRRLDMKTNIRTMRYIFSIFLVGIFTVINAEASQEDLLKEFDIAPNACVADKNHNLIYLSLTNSNSVTILDMNQLNQLDTIFARHPLPQTTERRLFKHTHIY